MELLYNLKHFFYLDKQYIKNGYMDIAKVHKKLTNCKKVTRVLTSETVFLGTFFVYFADKPFFRPLKRDI
jgi:hypothetical protein